MAADRNNVLMPDLRAALRAINALIAQALLYEAYPSRIGGAK